MKRNVNFRKERTISEIQSALCGSEFPPPPVFGEESSSSSLSFELKEREKRVKEKEKELKEKEKRLEEKERRLQEKEKELGEKELGVNEKERLKKVIREVIVSEFVEEEKGMALYRDKAILLLFCMVLIVIFKTF